MRVSAGYLDAQENWVMVEGLSYFRTNDVVNCCDGGIRAQTDIDDGANMEAETSNPPGNGPRVGLSRDDLSEHDILHIFALFEWISA